MTQVDGLGHHELMDDANVPSLLSIAYLGYTTPHDPQGAIADNTRRFVWSPNNRFFFTGSALSGIGSPHTRSRFVWPMSVIMKVHMPRSREFDSAGSLLN